MLGWRGIKTVSFDYPFSPLYVREETGCDGKKKCKIGGGRYEEGRRRKPLEWEDTLDW